MVKSKRAREAVEAEDKPADVSIDAIEVPAKKRKRDSNEDGSNDVKKVKKDKKEKKDKKDKKDKNKKESRRERKDKRKDLQDLPEQDSEVEDEPAKGADADTPMADADSKPAASAEVNGDKDGKKKDKKDKKDKKSKKDKKKDDADTPNGETNGDATESKKDKKKSKKNKKSSESENANDTPVATDATNGEANGEDDSSKNDRHIVFVGNLPYTATAESITAHFASLSPISVRCLRNRDDPNPCRGIAFVEFGKVWHQRTCLDKFHHSMFDDGLSAPRKINVELTAGGGGKTRQRQEKIKEKNRKLDENRTKRIEREHAAKEENKNQHMEDAIHPSRRGRVPNW